MIRTFTIVGAVAALPLLSGCNGVAGAAAQGVASEAIGASIQTASARSMTCEQIAADIRARERGKINPLAIPSINRQIARQEAVAREKGCPGY